MPAPDSIKRLVDTFARHLSHYKSTGYNETEVRREFLDPFFKALGWDIDNESGYADAYKDVIHEDAIKIGGYTKAPDYCFRIGGQRKFFLEAKKPAVNIKSDIAPAFQLRRYAWSAKLPLSILSDFEELAVYDCRVKPGKNDNAAKARTLYFTFDQYVEKWDEIASVFSREAVLKGSFDKYAESSKKKRGTAEVDDAFLAEIERWRELLARNFALRNPELSIRDLNFAVQKTIDRLIFLRICEDRGTEDYGRLQAISNGTNTYERLLELFTRADDRYNSGLFHFTNETGRPGAPDNLTPGLALDDKVLKDILRNFYYPDSPYEFSVLPADILGQVYEQFLGKTIRLTTAHQAKIEEKPEVRKAGGVYYTPKYIVDYIVENTLGRLLNGADPKNPKPIAVSKAAKLKVLDPACGSGSFLIVAYQYLLDWHRDQYSMSAEGGEADEGKIKRHAGGKVPKIYQARGGEYRLTTNERKRILLNNIHGVDIDSQSVEVTKLSLLLKVLEGETQQNLQRDFIKERERILPDLGNNIKCGNSLIGSDFYEQLSLPELDEEAQYRINVFDWESAFPGVFEQGGFDCVIGNPPYVRQESIKEAKEYFSRQYESYSSTADLYVYFLEKSVKLLNHNGITAYIVSSSFLKTNFGRQLRETLKQQAAILAVTDFGGLPVFDKAKDTYVCIPIMSKSNQSERIPVYRVNSLMFPQRDEQLVQPHYTIPQDRLTPMEWSLRSDAENSLLTGMQSICKPLVEYASGLYYGLKTGLNSAFVIGSEHAESILKGADIDAKNLIKITLGGKDIRRYHYNLPSNSLVVIPSGWTNNQVNHGSEQAAWQWFESRNPHLALHLRKYETAARKRSDQGEYWWELRPCDYYSVLNAPKIIFPDICKNPRFIVDYLGVYPLNTSYAIDSDSLYLLGILNSKLFWFLIGHISIPFGTRAGRFRYRLIYQYMAKVPIRPIDFDDPVDVEKHYLMEQLVNRMLELHQQNAIEKNPESLRHLEIQISITDRQIDNLVYDLYGLTDEEIALVESSV